VPKALRARRVNRLAAAGSLPGRPGEPPWILGPGASASAAAGAGSAEEEVESGEACMHPPSQLTHTRAHTAVPLLPCGELGAGVIVATTRRCFSRFLKRNLVSACCSAVLRRCGASVATACVCRAGGRVLLQELASFHVAATSSARSEERSFRVAALLRDGEPGVSILEAVNFD
jgi:hypothetical protein